VLSDVEESNNLMLNLMLTQWQHCLFLKQLLLGYIMSNPTRMQPSRRFHPLGSL